MGYRNYISCMPKREYNKIKSLTEDELYEFYNLKSEDEDEKPYKGVYEYGTELYNFGKYCDFRIAEKHMKPFFKNKELQSTFNDDYEFFIVNKEFLECIINLYKDRIKDYYSKFMSPFLDYNSEFLNSIKREINIDLDSDLDYVYKFNFELITDVEQTALFKIIEHVRSMYNEWKHIPFDLSKGEEITTSWKYEYGIFELVRIYKSFDWKKNVMIYYGY